MGGSAYGAMGRTACSSSRYFGQYGKILKIALSPGAATPPGTTVPLAHSCYITYANREEAEQAILAVDGVVLDGRTLKASFGTPTRYAQLSDELEFSRDLDDPAALPDHSKASESSRMDSSGRASMLAPTHALAPALAPPPVSPAAPSGASAVLSRQRCGTAGPAGPSAAVESALFALAAGHAMPERGDSAANVGSAELFSSVAPAQAVSSQGRGAIAQAPMGVPSPAVKAQPPGGGDSVSWSPHSLEELPRRTDSGADFAALDSVAGSSAVGGGAPVGGGAASSRVPYATGSSGFELGDSEPWSMMGGFEVLLSGSLPDEVAEETPLTSSSRFARFFDADDAAGTKPPRSPRKSGSLGAGGGHGCGLDGGLGGESKLLDEDWQEGFRALLPDVNISFSSPFGEHALSGSCPNVQQFGGFGGGLGGISSFSGFGSSRLGEPPPNAGVGASFGTVGNGGSGGGSSLLNGSLHHTPLNGVALPGLAGDSGAATPNTLLQQLSVGSLPGAQLPTMAGPELGGAELSSQLHSLLHGGGGSGGGGGGDGTAALSVMQRAQRLMPGWLPTDGLLAEKPDSAGTDTAPSGCGVPSGRDTGAPSGRAARERRSGSAGNTASNAAGNAAGNGGDGGGHGASIGIGGSDRGSKAKKRGGTNRGSGNKSADSKPVAFQK